MGSVITIALPNGRDLGGMPLAGGAILRPNVLLRSAAPASPEATASVGALGITHVVDLRTDAERVEQPNRLPEHVRTVVADVLADAPYDAAANVGRLAARALASSTAPEGLANRDLRAIMLSSYRDFVLLPSGRRASAQVLRLLADDSAGPVLIHCTAGKDRTGWIVALVLQMLGAAEADITADYLASGPAVMEMFRGLTAHVPQAEQALELLAPMLHVERPYLDAALDAATLQYGSLDAYVRDGLAIDDATIAAVRARLSSPRSGQSISARALT